MPIIGGAVGGGVVLLLVLILIVVLYRLRKQRSINQSQSILLNFGSPIPTIVNPVFQGGMDTINNNFWEDNLHSSATYTNQDNDYSAMNAGIPMTSNVLYSPSSEASPYQAYPGYNTMNSNSNVLYSPSSEASPYQAYPGYNSNTAAMTSNGIYQDTQANPLYSGAASGGAGGGSAGGVPLTANAMYQGSDGGVSQYSALGAYPGYYSVPGAIGGAESTYAVTGVPMTANVMYEGGSSSTDACEAGARNTVN